MSQFENNSSYEQSKVSAPSTDFIVKTESFIRSSSNYSSNSDAGEIDFDTAYPTQGDDSSESSEEEQVWYTADIPMDGEIAPQPVKKGQQLLEDNRVYVDSDAEQIDFGHIVDKYVFVAGDFDIVINDDGIVFVDSMNISNVKRAHVSSIGVHFETSEGTWTITNDGKTSFFGTDGKYYVTESNLYEMLKFFDITGTSSFNISELKINDDGSLTYTDTQANAIYGFDPTGRIKSFAQGDVTVEYDYNPTEEDKNAIREMDSSLYENMEFDINYVATTTIKGHKMKVYSIDNGNGTLGTHYAIGAALTYSSFSDRILSLIEENYSGTIIGPWELSSLADNHEGLAGYAHYHDYIFVHSDACDYLTNWYKEQVPLHEMGHIISHMHYLHYSNPSKSTGWYRKDLNDLYQKYNAIMPTLPASGYTESKGYPLSPDDEEFFADAVANYYMYPEELQRYAPEVYEFVEKIYGEEEYYHYGYA